MPTILGLDLGTNALKAGLFDASGRTQLIVRYPYPMLYRAERAAEQDPEAWWVALVHAVAELRRQNPSPIGAVCVIGQGPTLVVCDEALRARAPALVWADQRDHAERLRLSQKLGYDVSTYSLLPKVSWLARHQPDVFANGTRLTQAYDFVASRLVGHAFASQFGPWPPFDANEFANAGLDPAWIPPIVAMGAGAGVTRAPWAAEANLPEGVPVYAGVYDAIATTLGVALIEPGRACDYGGGSGGFGLCWNEPLTAPGIGCWPGLSAGQFVLGGATAGAGMTVDWFASAFGDSADTRATLAGAGDVAAGAEGLVFLPYLMGERSPLWDDSLRGAFVGLTHRHAKAHLARALLEGIAFGLRNIARVVTNAGGRMSELRVCGGTARYELLNQIKADVLAVPVRVPQVVEASLLGAAMLGAVGAGHHADYPTAAHAMVHIERTLEPDAGHRETYDKAFEAFLKLTELKLKGW